MKIDFNKNTDGLVPAIIQDNTTRKVLMMGYMNAEAVAKTEADAKGMANITAVEVEARYPLHICEV